MTDIIARFLVGGVTVSAFALCSDVLKPKSFAGLLGAAPSVALASLGLTIAANGKGFAATECRSMLAGAVALSFYSGLVCWLLMRKRLAALPAVLYSLPAWITVAFGLWLFILR